MRRPDFGLASAPEGLPLPGPERARILEEIAGDLEEMRSELIRRGMDPIEADREARRLLAPSDAAVAALASVHEPFYGSLARRFSSGVRVAEWVGLVGVTTASLAWVFAALVGAGVLRRPSLFLMPLLATAVAVVGVAGRKAIQLHLARDHEPGRLRSGMGTLLVGSGAAVLLGFGGAAYEMLRLAMRLEAAPERMSELVLPWLLDTSILIASGLATALVGGLAWFLLQRKVTAVERADLRAWSAVRRATSTASFRLDHSMPSTGVPS